MSSKPNTYVFTGGSSAGKSSIVSALEASGHICVPEAGRIVVREEQACGGDGLPWVNLERFRDLIFAKSLAAFEAVREESAPVFFDRSFIESIACSRGMGVAVPDHHAETVRTHRFNPVAFVTPPWEAIFTNDAERKTTFAAATQDFEMCAAVYEAAGYTLLEVPRAPVEERAAFVLQQIGQ